MDKNASRHTGACRGWPPAKTLYVFVDESGDLGFSERSTRHFVMCAVATENPIRLSRIVKKVRSKNLGTGLRDLPELKFHQSRESTRKCLLDLLASEDVNIWYVSLDKRSMIGAPPERQNEMYNYLAGFIVERMIKQRSRRIVLCLDRCMSKANRTRFDARVSKKKESVSESLGKLPTTLSIDHVASESVPGVQVADFVAGAIYAKYEHGDSRYYDIIESKISEEILKRKW
ncbi:MAG: DUF3800 domain-containing protein [Methanobacteriota archaeon]